MNSYKEVLDFWFSEENKEKWFVEDGDFDREIRDRFYGLWERAREGLLVSWRKTIKGRLAEILVLDQFSRNLFRGDRRSFSQDPMALVLAQEALKAEGFEDLSKEKRNFILMPFMHSESYDLHLWAQEYFLQHGTETTIEYEKMHRLVLQKFGRYPFRNEVLGRKTSPEEERLFGESMGNFHFPEELRQD